ncbi:hypothetical protein K7432_005013 [Basidiobolus ranarum]|uniref:Ribosomal protein/NADH dehydrogenase domain-containing protein n=1 Tax=Basidiobolus ranarum TaxID=34480 RepID=A0ABR2WX87_9FUNG
MKKLPNTQRIVNRLKFGVGATKLNPDIRKLTFEYRTRDPSPTVRFIEKTLPRLQFHNPGVSFEILRHTPVKFKPIRERKPREGQAAPQEAEKVEEGATEVVEEVKPVENTVEEVAEQAVEESVEAETSAPTPVTNEKPVEKKIRPTLKIEFANAKTTTWKLKNIHSKSIIEKLVNVSSENPNPKPENLYLKVKKPEVEL